MVRYVAAVASALLLVGAGVMLLRSGGASSPTLPLTNSARAQAPAPAQEDGLPEALPEASPKSREQKRFGRVDKDDDGVITREEYLLGRRKAFARLDVDGDGRLAFEEWAKKATDKFAGADKDRSGILTPVEFATTAVIRKPRARCLPPQAQVAEE